MTPLSKQTLELFGIDGQLNKLLEEIQEVLEAFPDDEQDWKNYDFLSEVADLDVIIESIDRASDGLVTRIADTKKLRTEIRLRSGYYG